MDVFRSRLMDEYTATEVILTAPTVPYKVIYTDGKEVLISNPADFPDPYANGSRVERVEEPIGEYT